MIMAWEEATKRIGKLIPPPGGPDVPSEEFMHYEPPLKQQVALLMSQWGAEQGAGTTFNFNLTGVKHPGRMDPFNTNFYFAATEEVFDKATAQGYVERGGALVEVLENDGANMRLRFKPDHPACAFRSFNTLFDGCLFHLNNLRNTYKEAWNVLIEFIDKDNLASLSSYADRLAAKRYFTGARSTYLANLTTYYKKFFNEGNAAWEEAYAFAEQRRR
jgi:hypothetical protein